MGDAPSLLPGPGQYSYVRSQSSNIAMYAGVDPQHAHAINVTTREHESWTSIYREGRIVDGAAEIHPLTPPDSHRIQDADRDLLARAQTRALEPEGHYFIGDEKLSRAELLAYPTDPKAIHDRLLAGVGDRGHSPEEEVFTEIGDALRDVPRAAGAARRPVRRARLRPGHRADRPHDRPPRRSGVAAAYADPADDIRSEIVIDPDTGELLAEQQRLAGSKSDIDAPVGAIVGDTVYLDRAVTNDLKAP